jgi:Fe-S cluster assembly ATPase SufC
LGFRPGISAAQLSFLQPVDGNIVKTGAKELASELEAKGCGWMLKGQAVTA